MPATPPPADARPPLPSGGPGAATLLWALLPVLVPGAGAPLAFGVAAGRRPSPVTVAPLVAYTAAFLGFFALILPFDVGETPEWALWSAFAVLAASTFGAAVHLLAIRGHVWAPREAPRPQAPARPSGEPDWVAPTLDRASRLREDARRLAEGDPALAKRSGVGRPDLPRKLDDGGLVDLNHAPVEALRDLPGFNEATARQVRERVERLGPFQHLDEVILEVGVVPGFERHLREYALLLP
ncbi:helix-hairpin-helix domain-containing protein [Glycomyces sp. A-F 0318]|uniref:ComEA family DNA-binding protein n=1 Tax=Glycomyces amatae TaxID=2881355 RepID=UPI001E2C3F87|nr:helix-hairpin-helix domain-containing protein [Glycomyces amatae]MCD0442525.1 helix-hairpin-helix domain-containing protein [Glycomyces amatae]